ncbi:hypothetical protein BDQ12DRAFT_735721 [Crucibulum laeve]|uniref:Uncharacterized protein n=1 Tax=Crucibulum laeve TaxID=68775 RepID=A0A5C3M0A6_9AGAR|nr:hypothetical protein BDQ12DRAFT_735721 [Crucibulum laeve]
MSPSSLSKPTDLGTQSPPLEATGEEKPMGASSVDSGKHHGHVSDTEQRAEYFKGSDKESAGSAKPEKMGQSLADTLEKQT